MEKFRIYGVRSEQETPREKAHRNLAREVAAEGMVLLKNDNVLPLKNKSIALYGNGARMTVRGGSGSGDMRERYSVNIEQGLMNAGFTIEHTAWLDRFDKKYADDKEAFRLSVEEKIKGYGPIRTMQMFDIIHEQRLAYPIGDEIKDDELTDATDTCIYVVARQAGEGGDRKLEKGDYLLADSEVANIKKCVKQYKNFLLVINCGSIMDLSVLDEVENIGAVLFFVQAGMEGGNAFADIVSGKVCPSGKLADTWGDYNDYPSADTFSHRNGELNYENYYEGIYVGYRYFDAFHKTPRFPFGFGLSYTTFEHTVENVTVNGGKVLLTAQITNTGSVGGKQVLQAYLAKPQGEYDSEKLSLAAFAKSKTLQPNEKGQVALSFDLTDFAIYDEDKGAFVLPTGEYCIFVGDSSRNVKPCAILTVDREIIVEKTEIICAKKQEFADLKLESEVVEYDKFLPRFAVDGIACVTHNYEKPQVQASQKIQTILNKLSNKDLIRLCVGAGYSGKNFNRTPGVAGRTTGNLLDKGIPDINLSDGPAGINVLQKLCYLKSGSPRYIDELPADWQWGWIRKFGKFVMAKPNKGTRVYQYMTAFPSETLQAQTWNVELIEKVGKAVGIEMLETGVTLWLAPGMNIHRNPLCGRNFEYYSEDPVLTGKMAAAITKGVHQNNGVSVTIKHFCCNNQEDNRTGVSENVSQRAMRELYLKGFRIAITEAKPYAVMTSYNKVNGVYAPNSYDLATKVLRNEWGFDGIVMSDWNSTDKCSHAEALKAGHDLIMPGNKQVRKSVMKSLKNKQISRTDLLLCASHVLSVIFKAATSKGF